MKWLTLILNLFFGLAILTGSIDRTPPEIAASFGATIVLTCCFQALRKKKFGPSFVQSLAEVMWIPAASLLFLRTTTVPSALMLSAVTTTVQYFLVEQNAVATSLVFAVTLMPPTSYLVILDPFNRETGFIIGAVTIAAVWSFWVGRWILFFSYAAAVSGLAVIVSLAQSKTNFAYLIAPAVSSGAILFAGLVMTDRRTSPESRTGQIFFGASVASLVTCFHLGQIYFPLPIAVFIVVAVSYLTRGILPSQKVTPTPNGEAR